MVEEFFSETIYVAKHICRDDLLPLKHCLDFMAKEEHLRRMLEWRVEIDRNWSLRAGVYGRDLKKYITPAVWSELESTYVGAGTGENWEALFKTISAFRKVAIEVADCLSYSYPHSLDERVLKYLHRAKRLGDSICSLRWAV